MPTDIGARCDRLEDRRPKASTVEINAADGPAVMADVVIVRRALAVERDRAAKGERAHPPQSSSRSRRTAGASVFFTSSNDARELDGAAAAKLARKRAERKS
jgi:hypothetical protein